MHNKLILPALIICLAVGGASPAAAQARDRNAPARTVSPRGPLLPEEQTAIAIFEEARSSVVYITTLVYQRDFFTFNVMEIPQGTGTGLRLGRAGRTWSPTSTSSPKRRRVRGDPLRPVELAGRARRGGAGQGPRRAPDRGPGRESSGRSRSAAPTTSGSARRSSPSATLSGFDQTLTTGRHQRARPGDRVRHRAARSGASSRPTPPSTRVTRAARCSTAPGAASASTPPSTAPRAHSPGRVRGSGRHHQPHRSPGHPLRKGHSSGPGHRAGRRLPGASGRLAERCPRVERRPRQPGGRGGHPAHAL